MEFLEVTYRISESADDGERLIESVLLEQTIETPTVVAERHPFVRENLMGRILEIVPSEIGGLQATLALPVVTASSDPAQFLNVLFGNSSLHSDVELLDLRVPQSLQPLLPGPQYGIVGIRRMTGVWNRPLTCSALKPVGLDLDELSALCADFVAGGIDLIKDDHYLADQTFAPFEDRVRACLESTAEAAVRTGTETIYVPNLSGTPDRVRRQAEFAQQTGAKAVMVAPMLMGMPLLHELCTERLDVPVLAHPSFGGAIRIRPATLFGKLFRLFGADAVIFANYGGRFSYPATVCSAIAGNLRSDWQWIDRSFPVPAGGMDADRASELVQFFGIDTILLVGGSLLEAGDALPEKARAFTDSVQAAAEQIHSQESP